jgi:hypothetical protein
MKEKSVKKDSVIEQNCTACITNDNPCIERDILMYMVLNTVEDIGGKELRNEFAERLMVRLATAKNKHNHF